MLSMCCETFLAAFRSGEPFRPTEKECNCGHHASDESFVSILLFEYFFVIAAIIDEFATYTGMPVFAGAQSADIRFTSSAVVPFAGKYIRIS